MTGSTIVSEGPYPAFDIIEFFKTRSALVVAAVAALDAMPAGLDQLKGLVERADAAGAQEKLQTLEALARDAAIDADNLLIADAASVNEPFVMCAVNRQPSGTVDVRTIELDRNTLALAGATVEPNARPLDRLATAVHALAEDNGAAAATAALDALSAQVRASVSRLSIVKARLDLQQSFLSSVMEADVGSSLVRLDSHLNQAGARDMALEARRLLSGRSLNIASGNRKTLALLFEDHAAKEG